MNRFRLSISIMLLAIFAASGILAWSAPPADKGSGVLLTTMQAELERAKTSLAKSDPAPYFISYEVYDQRNLVVAGNVRNDCHVRNGKSPLGGRNHARRHRRHGQHAQ